MPRLITALLLVLTAALAATPNTRADGSTGDKPLNVLFLIADDLNTDLGAYGHPVVKSPNIDKLARSGRLFSRTYCQVPLCGPSRSSFLTGRRPDVTGVQGNGHWFRDNIPQTVTLPQLFRKNNYYVARVGKLYHYGVPGEIGTPSLLDDPVSWDEIYYPRGRDKDDEDKIYSITPGNFGGSLSWYSSPGEDEEQTDSKVAEQAIELLREHRDEPFFLAVGFYRPHTPFVAPHKYFDMYPQASLPMPYFPEGDLDDIPLAARTHKEEEKKMSDERLIRECRQAYWACNTFMDAQVGKVIDELDRLGLRENTVIVMTSDHGYHLGEHGMWKKQSIFEESARVPLIIDAPGMPQPGKPSDNPTEMLDIYPTLAELCGLETPDYLDGVSLVPVLKDAKVRVSEAAMSQMSRSKNRGKTKTRNFMGYSIRTDRYRYTEWGDGLEGVELYDHQIDPGEITNLANDPAHEQTVARLAKLLQTRIHR
ncbi:MAG: sulfatase [Planctomycetota bacterium]|jgi:uncharacterized sulfatase